MVGIGPMSSVWVMVEQHHEGLEVRNAGLVDLMDFRTRHKVIIWTALLSLRVPCVREVRSDVLVEFQVANDLFVCVPLEVTDYLPQIILVQCSLGTVVMWPIDSCLPVVEVIEAPCLPVTEVLCQNPWEEEFEITGLLMAVFRSSPNLCIVRTAIHVVVVLSKSQLDTYLIVDWLLWDASESQVLMSTELKRSLF